MTTELKQLITGESMWCNVKYHDARSIKPCVKVLVLTNHRIGTSGDDSDGALRRLFILPFEYQVPDKEVDLELFEKLKGELSGILNIAVKGYKRLVRQGFVYSAQDESDRLIESFIKDGNPMRSFIKEKIVFQQGEKISYSEFKIQFQKWCKANEIDYQCRDSGISGQYYYDGLYVKRQDSRPDGQRLDFPDGFHLDDRRNTAVMPGRDRGIYRKDLQRVQKQTAVSNQRNAGGRGTDFQSERGRSFGAVNVSLSSDNFLCVYVCIPAECFCITGKFGGLSCDTKNCCVRISCGEVSRIWHNMHTQQRYVFGGRIIPPQ